MLDYRGETSDFAQDWRFLTSRGLEPVSHLRFLPKNSFMSPSPPLPPNRTGLGINLVKYTDSVISIFPLFFLLPELVFLTRGTA